MTTLIVHIPLSFFIQILSFFLFTSVTLPQTHIFPLLVLHSAVSTQVLIEELPIGAREIGSAKFIHIEEQIVLLERVKSWRVTDANRSWFAS